MKHFIFLFALFMNHVSFANQPTYRLDCQSGMSSGSIFKSLSLQRNAKDSFVVTATHFTGKVMSLKANELASTSLSSQYLVVFNDGGTIANPVLFIQNSKVQSAEVIGGLSYKYKNKIDIEFLKCKYSPIK